MNEQEYENGAAVRLKDGRIAIILGYEEEHGIYTVEVDGCIEDLTDSDDDEIVGMI